jgi:transcriptional regulator with XRE-family HTH domain
MAPGTRRVRRYAVAGPDKRERDDVLLEFGQKLKACRRAAGFTQERLALWCFLPREQIWGLEAGKRAVDVPDLLVLADRLSVPAGELIAGLEAPLRRVGTAQVLEQVGRQPGITPEELASSLGLPYSYAFEIAVYLQATGAIVSNGRGWHPTLATARSTTGS